jgi:hypothetical protein
MIAVQILAAVVGALVVVWVLWSAIRTVVVPRGESVWLSRKIFLVMRELFELAARPTKTDEGYDRIMARYAPTSLLVMPATWAFLVIAGFVLVFWGLGLSWREALVTSGSSFTTLGFARPVPAATDVVCFIEAGIGLGLVALLISYLPAIYSSFARREAEVVKLEVRAGSPPSASEFLIRVHRIRGLDYFQDRWEGWEQWFVELEESHASNPALVFFRSPRPKSSWITAAGTVLDTAALIISTIDIESSPQAQITIRSGYLALRRLAEFFNLPFDPDPAPDAPISIHREEFEALVEQLRDAGLPIKPDLDLAWSDYAGWRVNYDTPLLALCALTSAPYAPWSSDRVEHLGSRRSVRLGRGTSGSG